MSSTNSVPLPVLMHVNKLLYGMLADDTADDREPSGLWEERHRAMSKAIEMAKAIERVVDFGCLCQCTFEDDDVIAVYESERQNYLSEANRLDKHIKAIERLANPDLMGEAFAGLQEEFAKPRCWPAFIDAACAIRRDFSVYRSLGKEAERLSRRISIVAQELANLVRDIRRTGVRLPTLLTARWGQEGADWDAIAGSYELRELKTRQVIAAFIEGHGAKKMESLPDFHRQLIQLSDECRSYKADFMDTVIESALSSRQQSQKSAFLRAFAASLRTKNIKLTPAVKKAMAVAANALLDDPEHSISDDHVRKAIGTMRPAKRVAKRAAKKSDSKPQRKTRAAKAS